MSLAAKMTDPDSFDSVFRKMTTKSIQKSAREALYDEDRDPVRQLMAITVLMKQAEETKDVARHLIWQARDEITRIERRLYGPDR